MKFIKKECVSVKKFASLVLALCLIMSSYVLVNAEETPKNSLLLRVVGKGGYIISGGDSVNHYDNVKKSSRLQLSFESGSSFRVTAVANSGYEFLYWTNSSGRAILSPTIDFTLIADASYNAVFASVSENEEGNSHRVVFLDFSNRVAKSTDVLNGGSASAPTGLKAIPEMRHATWSRSFENITENTIIRPLYMATSQKSITVTGGTVGIACAQDDGTVTSYEYINSGYFNYNENLILKRDETDSSLNFAGWSADGGATVFTTQENYVFPIGADLNITAVYTSEEVTESAHISLLGATAENGSVSFLSIRNVPSDCEFLESGIIISNLQNSDLKLSDVDGTTVLKGTTIKTDRNGQYSLTKTGATGVWSGRAYLAYRDAGGSLKVISSSPLSVNA